MSKILFLLVCSHIDQGTIDNAKRMTCLCHLCGVIRGINDVITKEWYARCYDCRWRRWYGLNKDIARSASAGHWKKTNHRTSHGEKDRPAAIEAKKLLAHRGGGEKIATVQVN